MHGVMHAGRSTADALQVRAQSRNLLLVTRNQRTLVQHLIALGAHRYLSHAAVLRKGKCR